MRAVGINEHRGKRLHSLIDGPVDQALELPHGDPVELRQRCFPRDSPQVNGFSHLVHECQMIAPPHVQVVEHDLAGGLDQHVVVHRPLQLCYPLRGSLTEILQCLFRIEDCRAALIDDDPLIREELGVLPGLGVDLQQLAFGYALAVLHKILDALLLNQPVRAGVGGDEFAVAAGQDEFVLQGHVEHGIPGVTLAPRAPAKLVIQPGGFVPPRADDAQAAEFHHLVVLGLVCAAELDVRATTRHLRGHGDAPHVAGLRDDGGLLGIVLRVEHVDIDVILPDRLRQLLAFSHVVGADEDGLAGGVALKHVLHHGVHLLLGGGVDPVGLVEASQWLGAVDDGDAQVIEFPQLIGGFHGGARHATHSGVAPDKRLERHGIEDPPALGDVEPLLGLHCGLDSIWPPLQIGNAPLGRVDKLNLPIPDDVVHVALQQCLRV